jgi:hypothetical protein
LLLRARRSSSEANAVPRWVELHCVGFFAAQHVTVQSGVLRCN